MFVAPGATTQSQKLLEVEYELPEAPGDCEIAAKAVVGGSQLLTLSSWRLPEVDIELPAASRRLQKRLLAYSCREISGLRVAGDPGYKCKNQPGRCPGEGRGGVYH